MVLAHSHTITAATPRAAEIAGTPGPSLRLGGITSEPHSVRAVEPRLFGVLGDPVDHSLSPVMHNAAFAALGLPHLYLRWRVSPSELPAALREARQLGVAGLSLTVPLKETVLPLLDHVTSEARRIGAVNTIAFRDGRLLGDNTDGRGFARSLRGHARLRAGRAVLIGAGGSARAVASSLVDAGCRDVVVANRTPARGEALAAWLRDAGAAARAVPLDALCDGAALDGARLIVNTTSVGLAGRSVAVRFAAAPRRCLFVDLVYGPAPSPFLVAAARARRPTLDGAGMLLHQGALAFEWWTGRRAPLHAMVLALRSAGLALPRVR
jgi:shikimate dehydrogenase